MMKTIKKYIAWSAVGLFIMLLGFKSSILDQKGEIAKFLKTDKAWAEASAANDAKRMVSFYDTAGFFVNGTQLVKGHSDLEAFWKKGMSTPGNLLTWQAQGAEVSGNLGFTYGVWDYRFLKGNDTIKSKGIYLSAWRKQKNGDWKVLVDKP